ncbi:MAG: tyrosine-type recombinase/integrase [Solibacillus sp.]
MTKDELKEKLPLFIMEQTEDEKAQNTLKRYAHNINIFLEWLPDGAEVDKASVIDFKAHLLNECHFRTNTINNYIVSINKFLYWCGVENCKVKQLKKQHAASNSEILSLADYKRLLRFAKRLGQEDTYLIMKILAMTGIRIEELHFFTVENVKTNYIHVRNKGKERSIIIRQDLARELRQYCRNNGIKEGVIFYCKTKGKMMAKSTIWRRMKKLAGIAKIRKNKVHAHSFRHLFAKLFLEEYNGSIAELADILGHNSLETTRIYAKTTDEEKRRKLERIKF